MYPAGKAGHRQPQTMAAGTRRAAGDILFPSARGTRLSADGVQFLLAKHVAAARQKCPSLKNKRATPHVLRHSAAMELLQAGVVRSRFQQMDGEGVAAMPSSDEKGLVR
jgi:site-specific recombinase XerD